MRRTTPLSALLVVMTVLLSGSSLWAGAGCSQAESYFHFEIPKGWRLMASGG